MYPCPAEFPTNQLEMNAVADIFDRDNNGYINYKEFIAALWPEKVRGAKPVTDQQKIEDEVLYKHIYFSHFVLLIICYSTGVTNTDSCKFNFELPKRYSKHQIQLVRKCFS